jgi:hypothetical protein
MGCCSSVEKKEGSMASDPQRGVHGNRQQGTSDPERKLFKPEKAQRPSPGTIPAKAAREDDIPPDSASTEPPPTSGYDDGGEAGITNLPPTAEREQQQDLPPRGERKGNYHA